MRLTLDGDGRLVVDVEPGDGQALLRRLGFDPEELAWYLAHTAAAGQHVVEAADAIGRIRRDKEGGGGDGSGGTGTR